MAKTFFFFSPLSFDLPSLYPSLPCRRLRRRTAHPVPETNKRLFLAEDKKRRQKILQPDTKRYHNVSGVVGPGQVDKI